MPDTLCLATDLAPTSRTAWETAWRLAASGPSDLVALHVAGDRTPDWTSLPTPGELMERWGVPGQSVDGGFVGRDWQGWMRSAPGDDDEVLSFWIRFSRPELVVVGSSQRNPLLHTSIGAWLARTAPVHTLVVPDDAPGFIQPETGMILLKRVLVPLAPDVDAQPAVEAAVQVARRAGKTGLHFVFVYIGDEAPPIDVPEGHHSFLTLGLAGPTHIAGQITQAASDLRIDLIAMVTRGHDTWSDDVMGSHTDRVIRRSPCPVLVVRSPTP